MAETGVSSNILRSTLETGFTQDRIYTDYFLEKGDFFRIDNITLGHTFDKLWNEKDLFVSLSPCRMYVH